MSISVKIPSSIPEELNGRLLIIVDKKLDENQQLYQRVGMDGCPFFGCTYYGLQAEDTIQFEKNLDKTFGWPFQYKDLPNDSYYIQAFFIKYTKYTRKDGVTLYGMEDHGGGGNFFRNPYNLYSEIITANPFTDKITLTLNNEIPLLSPLKENEVSQQGNYVDTEHIKYVKFKSEMLSEFWNHDIYIGANILLPANYNPEKKYPVIYWQGHWPNDRVMMRYGTDEEFTEYWNSGNAPEVIGVTFRDANIFYDDSYHVNSANLGPYGDALVKEIIPAIEKQFSCIGTPEGRVVAGGSTGGWESMALQLFYPDFYGGSWPMFPDGMDFHAFQIIDLYNDKNAYKIDHNWYSSERGAFRDTKGNIIWTVRDENYYEVALGGDKAHGMGQWGIWDAVYSPVGKDGYPAPVFDQITGDIDKEVVEYWHQHYDLNAYLERNHETLIPKIKGKIHLRGGDMDNFYLNLAQYMITETLEKYDYQGYSKTFPRVGHSANMTMIELLDEIGEYFNTK